MEDKSGGIMSYCYDCGTKLLKIASSYIYVTVGDSPQYQGLYVSRDGGSSFTRFLSYGSTADWTGSYFLHNGYLASLVYEEYVLFFTDWYPYIDLYHKANNELIPFLRFPDPYHSNTDLRDAIKNGDVNYILSKDNYAYFWISPDGIAWYRMNSSLVPPTGVYYPIVSRISTNWVHSRGIAFKNLTKEQAILLTDSDLTSPTENFSKTFQAH